jgi:predicted MFS family arabinose efflux permease
LFGARDIWFEVGVPVFLSSSMGWSFAQVGSFLAAGVFGYGGVQSAAPWLLRLWTREGSPGRGSAQLLTLLLSLGVAALPLALRAGVAPALVVLVGLGAFGLVFALCSSVHSYLVLAFAREDRVSLDVGFYYMANALGRLIGTLLSGVSYELGGLSGCLWTSAAFALTASAVSLALPGLKPLAASARARSRPGP